MIPPYFQPWSNATKKLQKPLLEMTDLTIKTLKSVSFIKPQDLNTFQNPHALMEKQVSVFLHNSENSLHYFEETFKIFENMMQSWQDTVKEQVKNEVKQPYSDFIKPMAARAKRAEKTHIKKEASAQKKQAKTRVKSEKKGGDLSNNKERSL